MKDDTIKIIVAIPSIVAAYIAYVAITHGDGIALATLVGIITGLCGYKIGQNYPNKS